MKPLEGMDVYDDAIFYDREFADRAHDTAFFLRQAVSLGGPVLEVACGTGRITLPIARAGIEVTGLDVSRPMLELARRKAEVEQLPLTWLEQDCRDIRVPQTFALIFSATNAMQHLHDVESVSAFLGSARKALRPDGTLILDVFNPDMAKLARPPDTRYHHKSVVDEQGRELRVEASAHYDAATQILGFMLFYLSHGALTRTKKVSMRCFFPEELLALCQLNGLKVVRRCGNYDEGAFTSQSPKQILFCQAV
jgi:2-polyprenyl-3-methyl-5-hydroxy-6-metoxy-1,4-benzoquinol methylase